MSESPITLGTLATLLQGLEGRVNGRFDAVDGRLDEVIAHVGGVDQRLDRLEAEYHMLVVGLRRVEDRLERLEKPAERVEDRPGGEGGVAAELRELSRRVAHLQRAVESVEHALRAETADLSARLTLLQRQVDALEERIRRLPQP